MTTITRKKNGQNKSRFLEASLVCKPTASLKIRTKFGESTYCMVQWNSTVYENFSESENPLTLTSFAVLSIEIQN